MTPLPRNWFLIEEWEGSFVFENNDHSFNVFIDFDAKLKMPFLIGYEQLTGDYELIDFDENAFTVTASTEDKAIDKATLMMRFIDLKLNGTEEIKQGN